MWHVKSCCFVNQIFVMHVQSRCFANQMFVMHVQSCCSANQMFVMHAKENLLFCKLFCLLVKRNDGARTHIEERQLRLPLICRMKQPRRKNKVSLRP